MERTTNTDRLADSGTSYHRSLTLADEIIQYINDAYSRAGAPGMERATAYIHSIGVTAFDLQNEEAWKSMDGVETFSDNIIKGLEDLLGEFKLFNKPSPEFVTCIEVGLVLPALAKFHTSMFDYSRVVKLVNRVKIFDKIMRLLLCSAYTPGGYESEEFDVAKTTQTMQDSNFFQPLKLTSVCFGYNLVKSPNVHLSELGVGFLGMADINYFLNGGFTRGKRFNLGVDSHQNLPEAEWHILWKKKAKGKNLKETFCHEYGNYFRENPEPGTRANKSIPREPYIPLLDCLAILVIFATYDHVQVLINVILDQGNKQMSSENAFFTAHPALWDLRCKARKKLLDVNTKVFREPGQLLSRATKLREDAERLGIFGTAEKELFAMIYSFMTLLDEAQDLTGRVLVMIDEANTLGRIETDTVKLIQKIANSEKKQERAKKVAETQVQKLIRQSRKTQIPHDSTSLSGPPSASSSHNTSTSAPIVHISIPSVPAPLPHVTNTQTSAKQHTQSSQATTVKTNIRGIKIDPEKLEEVVKANNQFDPALIKIALQVTKFRSELTYQDEVQWINIEGFEVPTRLCERSHLLTIIKLFPDYKSYRDLAKFLLGTVGSSKRPEVDLKVAAQTLYGLFHILKHWYHLPPNSSDIDKSNIKITFEELVLGPYRLILQGRGEFVRTDTEGHRLAKKYRGQYRTLEQAHYYILFRYQKDWPLLWTAVSYGPYELGLETETVASQLPKLVVRI